MAGHAQLKFVMTECSKTQIRLTGLNYRGESSNIFNVLLGCTFVAGYQSQMLCKYTNSSQFFVS